MRAVTMLLGVLVLMAPAQAQALAAPPAITSAAPANAAGDNATPDASGVARITFSPNGDGHNDVATVVVSATPGTSLRLVAGFNVGGWHTAWSAPTQAVDASGQATFSWTGVSDTSIALSDGSYVLLVCTTTQTAPACSSTKVVAHLRRLSLTIDQAGGVDAGASVPIRIDSDRPGPFTAGLYRYDRATSHPLSAFTVPAGDSNVAMGPGVTGGFYQLCVTDAAGDRRCATIVVHGGDVTSPRPGETLIVYPLLTFRAYNYFDSARSGQPDTWYAGPSGTSVPLITTTELPGQPAPCCTQGDLVLPVDGFMTWLSNRASYARFVTDYELTSWPLSRLVRYRMVAIVGHAEYYETPLYDLLHAFRDQGGRIAYLSSNGFFGTVSIGAGRVTKLQRPLRTPTRSDFALLGVGVKHCCTWASASYLLTSQAINSAPWFAAGTGLAAGQQFGVVQGELDGLDAKLSPATTLTLARIAATPPSGPSVAGAMTLLPAARGGLVFAAGQPHFIADLGDPVISRLATNVWTQFLTPTVTAQPVIGSAYPLVGDVLQCASSFAGAASITTTWLRGDTPIFSSPSPTYQVHLADAGAFIRCVATASDASGAAIATTASSMARAVAAPLALRHPRLPLDKKRRVRLLLSCPAADGFCRLKIVLRDRHTGHVLAQARITLPAQRRLTALLLTIPRHASHRGWLWIRYQTMQGGAHLLIARVRLG